MKKLSARKIKMFKIKNRRGYACVCCNSLTEGKTPLQAYARMVKAQKRDGCILAEADNKKVNKLLTNV